MYFFLNNRRKENPQKLTQIKFNISSKTPRGKKDSTKRHHHRHHKRQPGEQQFRAYIDVRSFVWHTPHAKEQAFFQMDHIPKNSVLQSSLSITVLLALSNNIYGQNVAPQGCSYDNGRADCDFLEWVPPILDEDFKPEPFHHFSLININGTIPAGVKLSVNFSIMFYLLVFFSVCWPIRLIHFIVTVVFYLFTVYNEE